MSEALIQRYYAAFNRGDSEALLACLADDVAQVNQGETRHGIEAFARSRLTWPAATRRSWSTSSS